MQFLQPIARLVPRILAACGLVIIIGVLILPAVSHAMGHDPDRWREAAERWRQRHQHRAVPELDPSLATTAAVVMLGGCAVIMSRRRP